MGSPTGLVLECRPSITTTTTCVSRSFSFPNDQLSRMHRLEEYLNALEEERKKIEAFKRELPICMQLLHDAIEAYKEQLTICKPSSQRWPQIQVSSSFNNTDWNLKSPIDRIVLEEFIPLKKPTDASHRDNSEDELPQKGLCKPNWMKAAECLNAQAEANSHNQERCQSDLAMEKTSLKCMQKQAFSTSSKPFFHSKNNSGGAFTPFSRERQVAQPTSRPRRAVNPIDLALAPRDLEVGPTSLCENTGSLPDLVKNNLIENVQQQSKELVVKENEEGADGMNDSLPARKSRRCWSPELHRCFVNALQQLGGSQVATPKQIRELMKVEGLTNDEVKSHLQKYRLHTRRLSPSQTTSHPSPQVVVLGGIWVPPGYAVHAAAQQDPALNSSSRQQLHLCHATSSQKLCPELGSPSQMHLHSSLCCDQKLAPAHSQSSLQCPLQLTGQSLPVFHHTDDAGREESVGDDGGSKNSSWKGRELGLRLHDVDAAEDHRSPDDSVNGNQSHCAGEDDTEIEDSRGSETSLKM